jgi:hypothetical protein
VANELSESDDLAEAWHRTQAALPSGWTIDSLRCASEGLAPDLRSDEWVGIAVGPDGAERRSRASDPIAALEALVALTR